MPKKKHEQIDNNKNLQPVLNIGLCGHVDHGKTTLLERLSGKWADTHSEEIKRGITIRLGYADTILRICEKCNIYTVKEKCAKCNDDAVIRRKVSFVDAPGHESLMATMLSGATLMDAALLLVSANETCPQPQTREHLMALKIIGIKKIIIVQNKIDLVSEESAIKNYENIKGFIKGTDYEHSPIIPISAFYNAGIDFLIKAIEEYFSVPERNPNGPPIMLVARSFDINHPGIDIKNIIGGVLGGSIKQGKLSRGDEIEIRPGYMVTEKNQNVWKPLFTKIVDIKAGGVSIDLGFPGGTIGLLTSLDPSIVKADKLVGNVVGLPGKLPKVWNDLTIEIHLLDRVVGVAEQINVEPIKINEVFMLNVNTSATVGIVTKIRKRDIQCKLKLPVCAETGSRITLSRMVGNRFRLIGYGIIK
ncbi:MAG: translation initiation factor IF-2 subunit gamma [Nanoarchaeota archaeon]